MSFVLSFFGHKKILITLSYVLFGVDSLKNTATKYEQEMPPFSQCILVLHDICTVWSRLRTKLSSFPHCFKSGDFNAEIMTASNRIERTIIILLN